VLLKFQVFGDNATCNYLPIGTVLHHKRPESAHALPKIITVQGTVLLEKLRVAQLLKKFVAFQENHGLL